MIRYPLAKDGVFWTIQGEGALTGEPMAFVRLAGCSVGCPQCDTDYAVYRRVTVDELVAEVQSVVSPERQHTQPWVWITGGEPNDHDLEPLIDVLHTVGFKVAVATSGKTAMQTKVDWLSVSPHSPDLMQRHGHELKIVPSLNGLRWEDVPNLGRYSFAWRFIQPLAGSADEMQKAIAFVRDTPGWRLSIQAHKVWGIA